MKGFISFIVAAVFLFALIPAAALVSSAQPDLFFENNRALLVQEVAVKQAFFESTEKTARDKYYEMKAKQLAQRQNPAGQAISDLQIQLEMEQALRDNLQNNLKDSFNSENYEVVFWCLPAGEDARKASSDKMLESDKLETPIGTQPISSITCIIQPFTVRLDKHEVELNQLGFTIFDKKSKIGKAAVFPHSYRVDFK